MNGEYQQTLELRKECGRFLSIIADEGRPLASACHIPGTPSVSEIEGNL